MNSKRNGWSKRLISIGIVSLVQTAFSLSAIANTSSSTSEMSGTAMLLRRCTLDESDTTFPDSGQPFDTHFLLNGNGQIVTVILESDDFDAQLSIYDPSGNLVAYNDDMSTYAGNSTPNAGTSLQLWDNGIFTIVVTTNSSTVANKGEYSLIASTLSTVPFTPQPEIIAGCTGK